MLDLITTNYEMVTPHKGIPLAELIREGYTSLRG